MEKIFESEYRFLCVLWENEPIGSTELIKICEQELGWKKSTTYTVIKKLSEKGIVKNEQTIVSALISKEEVDKRESDAFLERSYNGDIPAFLASFLKDRKITASEAERIKKLIEEAAK